MKCERCRQLEELSEYIKTLDEDENDIEWYMADQAIAKLQLDLCECIDVGFE